MATPRLGLVVEDKPTELSCDQDTTASAIHIIEFTKAKYSGTYFCGNPWLYIVEEI